MGDAMKKLIFPLLFLLAGTSSAEIRTKTIEYSFYQSTETVLPGTDRNFLPLSINIPETTGRNFRSVYTYMCILDTGAAVSPTFVRTKLGIDAVAVSTVGVADSISSSGENMSFIFISTFTNYFNTNFSAATSCVVSPSFMMLISTTNNASMKIVLTYDYDDSATTQIKTVNFLLQGSTNSLSAVLSETAFGKQTNQIPVLDTILPEKDKVFRDIYFHIISNEGTASNGADTAFALALDSEGELTDMVHETALTSARHYSRIWKRPDIDTSTTHALKARTTSVSNMPMTPLGVIFTVTYEYNAVTSTEIMNSIILPVSEGNFISGGTSQLDRTYIKTDFLIPEVNPVLKHSGLLGTIYDGGLTTLVVYSNNQVAYTTYTFASVAYCGNKAFSHRIDVNDPSYTLRKGTNSCVFNFYRNTSTVGTLGSGFGGFLYLNYVSSNSALPGKAANLSHTVFQVLQPYVADAVVNEILSTGTIINESNYYLHDIGFLNINFAVNLLNPAVNQMYAKISTSEASGFGWVTASQTISVPDAEFGPIVQLTGSNNIFNKYPNYSFPGKLNPSGGRRWRASSGSTDYYQSIMIATYHSTTYTITGTISGYTGDGSGITVEFFRSDNDTIVNSATTATGGTFTAVWYDDTIPLYAVAIQDSTHKGVSATGIAGTDTFDISFTSGGSPTGGVLMYAN